MARSGSGDVYREETAASSEDGYAPDTSEDPEGTAVTEQTGLLGAGAQETGNGRAALKDRWAGFEEFEGLPWYRVPSVYWLIGPYALFTLAFGGSLVPKLNLLIDLVCNKYLSDRAAADPTFRFHRVIMGGDNPQCRIPEVQRSVATFTLGISVIVGILSAFTAPRLGALSDRVGRKRVMVVCGLGGISAEIITILAGRFPDVIHYNWLIAAAVCDGLTGSFTAGSVLSHSYTSDCTPPSKRGVAIGYLHSCLFTGLAFGPLLAAYLVKWTGTLLSIFYVTLGCHIAFILFILLILPESVSKRRQLLAREKFAKEVEARAQAPPAWHASLNRLPHGIKMGRILQSLDVANPFAPLRILWPTGPGSARLRRNLVTFAGVDMAILGAAMSSGTVVLLYSELTFGWGNFETSGFVSLVSLVRVFVLVGIFPVVNYIFRVRPLARRRRESGRPVVETNAGADELDLWVLRTALVSDVVGVVGYIFVRTPALFVACGAITAVGGLGSATIQAALSKHVPPERVGQLLGAIGVLHALSRVVSPIIFNGLYALTVESFPQAFFLLLALLFALSLVGAFMLRPHVFMKEGETEPDTAAGLLHGQDREDTLVDEEIVPRI